MSTVELFEHHGQALTLDTRYVTNYETHADRSSGWVKIEVADYDKALEWVRKDG